MLRAAPSKSIFSVLALANGSNQPKGTGVTEDVVHDSCSRRLYSWGKPHPDIYMGALQLDTYVGALQLEALLQDTRSLAVSPLRLPSCVDL